MLSDIRFGIRALLQNPSFTVVAVLALAIAIGTNTAIFSVINTILLRPLPYKDPARMVIPVLTNAANNVDRGNVSYTDYLAWREDEVFEHAAVFREITVDVTGADEPEQVQAAAVSNDYFSVLGIEPFIGRTLLSDDQRPNNNRVVVLSHGLWQRRFGSDIEVLGQMIGLNGQQFRVVGVMAPDSQWPKSLDVLYPMGFGATPPAYAQRYDNFVWGAVARLKPDESIDQAQAHLETIARRMEREHPDSRMGWSATAIPIDEWVIGRQFRLALLVLFGAGALVLLIACANIANLLLVRAVTREREFAVRIAIGARRLRLIRQLMTESLLLGLLGGLAGLLLALGNIKILVASAPANIPRLSEVTLDGRVLAFALAVSVLTPLAFGLIPASQASKVDLNESLKDGGRSASGGLRARRIRRLLVAIEVALALMLSISAGLMIKSFVRLQQVDPGFRVENLVTMRITLPRTRYPNNEVVATSYERIMDRIDALPGVDLVCASSSLPLGGGGHYLPREFLAEGRADPPAGTDYPAHWVVVTNDYFDTMGIPLLKGRSFTKEDTAESPMVIIINEAMARQMFPGQDPLGNRIRSWRDENKLREIVGVVADVRYLGRDDMIRPLVYVPHRQDTWIALVLTIRTAADPTRLISTIRGEIRAMDKDLAIAHVETMDQVLTDSVSRARFTVLLLGIFAFIALVLAAVGVYGIMSYAVTQRTHEIGIRMALGAQPRDLFKLIIGEGLVIALIGVVIGLAGSLAVTRVMSSLLFDLTATDQTIFAGASLLLICVAVAASYFPTRRAVRVDPMASLRM
jgi:putative ABC transport system permease protein